MFDPFFRNLPEYGYVAHNFWNNVGGHAVADPFDTVTDENAGHTPRSAAS